ncbi:MAG TPA: hypothetical protein VI195_01445 [Steroidobacteraceae bacterium]
MALLKPRTVLLNGIAHERSEIRSFALELDVATSNACDIEKIIDQVHEPVRLPMRKSH